MNTSSNKSICFVALNAFGALSSNNKSHAGGIEQQQSLMAKWLAEKGWRVSMITWDEGFEDGVEVDGVKVFKMCRREDGVPVVRFLYPRWSSLNAAMKRADADIYYYNCGDLGLGQVVLWAHRHDRKVIYSVASDPDCDPKLPVLKPLRERVLYRYGVNHCDRLFAQTHRQQAMLKEGFGRESVVLDMPSLGLGDAEGTNDFPDDGRFRVLWVGRISQEKRLEWLLEIAKRCPEMAFDVVGAANIGTEYSDRLMDEAGQIENVHMHGRVIRNEIGRYFRRASVLCCTSVYEGFPNTFLEAWSIGLPVVTTFDPDGVVRRNELGFVSVEMGGLVEALRKLAADDTARGALGRNARLYFNERHAVGQAMQEFENQIDLIYEGRSLP
ncbi:MAG: glycosyltransferase [Gammaproteobacteria bacterium]|nr:glycosyltransferase [Gammaproteobacteria bacterium]